MKNTGTKITKNFIITGINPTTIRKLIQASEGVRRKMVGKYIASHDSKQLIKIIFVEKNSNNVIIMEEINGCSSILEIIDFNRLFGFFSSIL